MYIRVTKNQRGHAYYHLVESYRQGGKSEAACAAVIRPGRGEQAGRTGRGNQQTSSNGQHIYRSLDLLAQHKEEIERFLYRWEKDLFTINVDVVLYNLTTLRFERTREDMDELRRFGYSKEMRSDCTQIVLGLLTDTNGVPLCFEVHPGNTFEGNTLTGIVEKMQRKFSIRRFIFNADRRLFSFANLEHIRESQGEFIVGLKMGSLEKEVQEDFYQMKNFTLINEEVATAGRAGPAKAGPGNSLRVYLHAWGFVIMKRAFQTVVFVRRKAVMA